MWPAFLIGLFSEFFSESKEVGRFILKGFASAVVGLMLNFVLLLLISRQAVYLIGQDVQALSNITVEFVLMPFLAAFIALIVVKTARYLSTATKI